jgi:hypothetical protein
MHINRECSFRSQKLREAKEIIILIIPFITSHDDLINIFIMSISYIMITNDG